MNSSIANLKARLGQCMLADIHPLQRRLVQAEQRLKNSQPASRMFEEIEGRISESEKRVELRAGQLGEIRYPDLPVSKKKDEIKNAIAENQVVVIAGETGSGKTTQLPKICLELGLGVRGLIGHTQPRRLAARTVAGRIAEEVGVELGGIVGYQVRFTDQVTDSTMVKLMTDGILLAETQRDRYLNGYEVLIIDEAHERSLNIDFLLGYLKRILPQRPDLKVIITSATIDLERFSQHFDNAPIIEVSGRTYPVETLYRPLNESEEGDIGQAQGILLAVEELRQIERQQKRNAPGDILVFLSGEREIRETADFLRKAQLRDTEILPLYARLSVAEQNKIFHQSGKAGRRIVLATNVAETSLTVPGIRYVIDPGYARISRYSYRSKVQRLPVEAVSQASANQRKGRCGRVAEGICIRLYSEEDFNARPQFTDAEIRRTNLASVILQMLNLKLGDISEFPFIDPPDSRFINDGFKLLQELGAVDAKRLMTQLGRNLSKLPVDPRIGRMVLEAARQGSLSEVLVIASALSVQDPRERPADKQQAADQKHREYADEDSDFMSMLNLWTLYEEQRQVLSQNQLRKYCQKQFLSYMKMREWRDIHRQLHLVCKELGLKENSDVASYETIHKALLAGLLSHMGFKQESKEYLGARNKRFHIFPGSMLFKKAPKWIMAAELVETARLYARMVAKVEPQWAESLAKHLVKRSYLEPHWEKKRAQVVAFEQVTLYGLVIVNRRKIHYGQVDPQASHDIFIRQALVEGEFHTKGAFFSHNRALLRDIEELEAKSRRRDLLVDEEQLYQFYRLRLKSLAGDEVINGAGFEVWRKGVELSDPKALFMAEDDILQRSAEHVSARQYPDKIDIGGAKLRLSYHFEPGAVDDGVTLHLPLALLNQLPLGRLEWLVPGMLREKCIAILKGLPKQQRKNYVPIPDYVEAILQKVVFAEGDLYEAIALQLKRMTGAAVDVELLRASPLEVHSSFNLNLLDENGKTLDQSRDWAGLNEKYADQLEAALQRGPGENWGREGITRWDFGELPEFINLRQAGGIEVEAFPALVNQGEQVVLKVLSSAEDATYQSVFAICRLAEWAMKDQIRAAKRAMPELDKSVMLASKVMTKQQLESQIIIQALRQVLKLEDGLPRDEAEFRQKIDAAKSELVPAVAALSAFVFKCHQSYHSIQKQLKGKMDLAAVVVLNDVKQQLACLISSDYLRNTAWSRLQHFPRYLNAIDKRLEKFRREINRERMLSEQLSQCWAQYQAQKAQLDKQGIYSAELESYRWMLEEYRVSLFAQQLGTEMTVSEKRLKQQWLQATR